MRPNNSRREFDRCWDWLDASQASFGRTHTKAQIWERIYHGHATLWPGANAVVLSEVVRHPIGYKSLNTWLQGGSIDEIRRMHSSLEEYARELDCARLIAWGRDGWLRVLTGYENCGTRRAKWLTDVPEFLRATKT